jgi:hypothetical protein
MHYRRVLRTGQPGPPGPLRVRGICRVEGCEQVTDAKGLGHGLYQRLLKNSEDIASPLRGARGKCSVEGCDRPSQAKGFCGAHYKRVLAMGDARWIRRRIQALTGTRDLTS